MDKKTYTPFEEYYKQALPNQVKYDNRSLDEIMDEILKVNV